MELKNINLLFFIIGGLIALCYASYYCGYNSKSCTDSYWTGRQAFKNELIEFLSQTDTINIYKDIHQFDCNDTLLQNCIFLGTDPNGYVFNINGNNVTISYSLFTN